MAQSLRMRVFAGPNGSGKSTMYEQVRSSEINGRLVDLGVYLNPDDIAKELKRSGEINLVKAFKVLGDTPGWRRLAHRSGLLHGAFDERAFKGAHRFNGRVLRMIKPELTNEFAQLLTAYLCELLLKRRKKFSFETVFSHPSKLDLMERARRKGYKVYLYFIATNSPEINKDRVKQRVLEGGHDVDPQKIEKRYELALKQVLPAMEICYHGFVFDNSGSEPVLFVEMKKLPARSGVGVEHQGHS